MRRREFVLLLGGAVTPARALRAQQKAVPLIGYLTTTAPSLYLPFYRQGLSEMGYVEGQTWPSNTAGLRATMIGCLRWPPISSAARLT
jgi:hypothetical protein